jgi:histidyl-tRNA synthetase
VHELLCSECPTCSLTDTTRATAPHTTSTTTATAHATPSTTTRTAPLRTDCTARRAVGEGSDIVGKEMFSFPDGVKGDVVAMRPEGTAGVMRAVLSAPPRWRGTPHSPTRLYYHGPMFRRERPQKGRYRQFTQFGVEHLGCGHPHTGALEQSCIGRCL